MPKLNFNFTRLAEGPSGFLVMTLRHHSPPAVTVQVGLRWLLGAALLVLACLGLAAVAYVGWASSGRVALGLLAVWALGVWGPERHGAICPRGRLRWDRQAWSWQANADGDTHGAAAGKCIAITALKVAIDMQIALSYVKTDVGSYFSGSKHRHRATLMTGWRCAVRYIPALLGCCSRRCSEALFLTA